MSAEGPLPQHEWEYLCSRRLQIRIRSLTNRLYQQDRQRIMELREGLVKAASIAAGSAAFSTLLPLMPCRLHWRRSLASTRHRSCSGGATRDAMPPSERQSGPPSTGTLSRLASGTSRKPNSTNGQPGATKLKLASRRRMTCCSPAPICARASLLTQSRLAPSLRLVGG